MSGRVSTLCVIALALAVSACDVGSAEVPTASAVDSQFGDITASSWIEGELLLTELRDGDGSVLASAEWQLASRSGVLETNESSIPLRAGGDRPLDGGIANGYAYSAWLQAGEAADPDDETAYTFCYEHGSACSICWTCTDCRWVWRTWFPEYVCYEATSCSEIPDCRAV